MPYSSPTIQTLQTQANSLIRAELYSAAQREKLEQGIVDAVQKLGVSVDDLSAATGLTIEEIRGLLSVQTESYATDLAALSGMV